MSSLKEMTSVREYLPSRTRLQLLGILGLTLAVVGAGGTVLVADQPFATLGIGTTTGDEFTLTEQTTDNYTVTVKQSRPVSNGRVNLTNTISKTADGTRIERRTYSTTNWSALRDNVTHSESVVVNGTGYQMQTYRNGTTPPTIRPDWLVVGNRTYDRLSPDEAEDVGSSVFGTYILRHELVYTHSGSVTRNGETLQKYTVVGTQTGILQLFMPDRASGYLLVDDERRIRYATITFHGSQGANSTMEYIATPDDTLTTPDWVSTAKQLPNTSQQRPPLTAYWTQRGVVVTGAETWTPPANATITLVYESGQQRTTSLNTSRPLPYETNSTLNQLFVAQTPTGITMQASPPDGATAGDRPKRIIVDADGLNYYNLRVQSTQTLVSWYSITPARLRPSNGGGRVFRVDSFGVNFDLRDETTVTFTIGNQSVSRSLTVPAANLSLDRFYLIRTPDGLAVTNDDRIGPYELSPPDETASRRFVANATLTISVDGIPVASKQPPEYVTQASDRELARIQTGVSVQTHAKAPDHPMHSTEEYLESQNWTGHTLVDVHNWNYEAVYVEGPLGLHPSRCGLDQTCYYRAPDGATITVKTPNGTVLYHRAVEGNETITP